ncbi:phosphate transport system permease PstC [Dehalogenimonas sp. WBC-2]|nr:phosphate transport system permease PstC [Dehalogenimonas sp. WBC-2]
MKHIKKMVPKTLFFILAMVPVIALILITVNLIAGSILAVDYLGFGLFKNSFIPSPESANGLTPDQMNYGILPALWGTLLVVGISVSIAFPISLALAVLTNEYLKRPFNSMLRAVMGVLSGIPPIIYAFIGGSFYLWFLWPKLAGKALSGADLPAANMLPTDQSATILGAMMLAMLIVPFLTPLLDDAIHNVPSTLKEASLSLGAGQWHTLRSVTLQFAMPGLLNALLLGILTALGEAIIVSYTIGFTASALPQPIFDLLQRTPPFTATIAYLTGGGFSFAQLIGPVGKSVGHFMGLLLLIVAFVILGFTTYIQHRIAKRVTL